VTVEAPPVRSGAPAGAGRTLGVSAFGGAFSFAALVVLCQVLALAQYLALGGYGLWSWAKIGLLTALLSLRADVFATLQGPPAFQTAARSATIPLRVVPMVLTIGFFWLAALAGRRAARARPGGSPFITSGLAAAGAGFPVALLAGICASLVTLSFPTLGLDLRVDVRSAALWAGVLAAAGAGVGAYLEAGRGRTFAGALRGGLTAYGWALGLIAVGVFVLATFEPTLTRAYVNGWTELGAPGRALLGFHLLAFPAQSALLLAPASGSCLEIIGEGPMFDLCPWHLVASGPTGAAFLPEPLALSPWLWLLSAVPFIAAVLGGGRAVTGMAPAGRSVTGERLGARRVLWLGVAAGSTFALLVVLGAWFAAPRLSPVVVPVQISMDHMWARTAIAALIWGTAGAALGAWLVARRYGEPELPRPTSA
jgi:hypothetical protein